MIKHLLGSDFKCWKCDAKGVAAAGLHENMVQWRCDNCGATNYVIIDTVRLRIGQRLWGAAADYLNREEYDLAAILLVSSVDASLGVGIHELTIWRALEQRLSPPEPEDIDKVLAHMNHLKKVAEFERLAGAKFEDEIIRLSHDGKIPAVEMSAFQCLKDEFKKLAKERNRLIHLGENVDPTIIREGSEIAKRYLRLLEAMYHAAFDLNRPSLPGKSPAYRSRGTTTSPPQQGGVPREDSCR